MYKHGMWIHAPTRQDGQRGREERRPPLLWGSLATRWRPTPTRRKKPPNLVACNMLMRSPIAISRPNAPQVGKHSKQRRFSAAGRTD